MLLRPEEHGQLGVDKFLESYRRDARESRGRLQLLRFLEQLAKSLGQQVKIFALVWLQVQVGQVGLREEEVAEKGRVKERLEDSIDIAGITDVVQACEVKRDLISL